MTSPWARELSRARAASRGSRCRRTRASARGGCAARAGHADLPSPPAGGNRGDVIDLADLPAPKRQSPLGTDPSRATPPERARGRHVREARTRRATRSTSTSCSPPAWCVARFIAAARSRRRVGIGGSARSRAGEAAGDQRSPRAEVLGWDRRWSGTAAPEHQRSARAESAGRHRSRCPPRAAHSASSISDLPAPKAPAGMADLPPNKAPGCGAIDRRSCPRRARPVASRIRARPAARPAQRQRSPRAESARCGASPADATAGSVAPPASPISPRRAAPPGSRICPRRAAASARRSSDLPAPRAAPPSISDLQGAPRGPHNIAERCRAQRPQVRSISDLPAPRESRRASAISPRRVVMPGSAISPRRARAHAQASPISRCTKGGDADL